MQQPGLAFQLQFSELSNVLRPSFSRRLFILVTVLILTPGHLETKTLLYFHPSLAEIKKEQLRGKTVLEIVSEIDLIRLLQHVHVS